MFTYDFYTRINFFLQGMNFMFILVGVYVFLVLINNDRLKKTLGYLLLYHAFMYIKYILIFYTPLIESDYWRHISRAFDTWLILAYSFYLLELIKPGWITWKKGLLAGFPFLLLTSLYIIIGTEFSFRLIIIYAVAYGLIVYLYFILYNRKYKQLVYNYYSYTKSLDTKWIVNLINALFVSMFFWAFFKSDFNENMVSVIYYLLTLCINLYVVYHGFHQEILVSSVQNEKTHNLINQEIFENSSEQKCQIENLLYTRNIYLNPKLTLNDLASEIGTNRTYLSNYLNQSLGTTFFDYINKFRIEYAEEMLANPENNDKLETIAEKSGFNSLSTFRRAFERTHGCTPAEFRKKQKEK